MTEKDFISNFRLDLDYDPAFRSGSYTTSAHVHETASSYKMLSIQEVVWESGRVDFLDGNLPCSAKVLCSSA